MPLEERMNGTYEQLAIDRSLWLRELSVRRAWHLFLLFLFWFAGAGESPYALLLAKSEKSLGVIAQALSVTGTATHTEGAKHDEISYIAIRREKLPKNKSFKQCESKGNPIVTSALADWSSLAIGKGVNRR